MKSLVSSSLTRSGETVATRPAAACIAASVAGVGSYSKRAANWAARNIRSGSSTNVSGAEDVDAPRADIGFAAVGIDQLAGGQRASEHVHAEIAAREVVLEGDIRPALDREVAVPVADRPLASRKADVDGLTVDGQLEDGESGADEVEPPKRRQPRFQLLERNPGDEVVQVFAGRLRTFDRGADLIPNPPADGKKRASRQNGSEFRVKRVGAIHYSSSYRIDQNRGCFT